MMCDRDEPAGGVIGKAGFWRLALVRGLAMIALAAITGCFGNGSAAPSWKPWRESNAALPAARAGNPWALHESFHAAYAEEMRPYPNRGEPAHDISGNLDSILDAVGDQAFANALLKERPLARSAVRDCMTVGDFQQRYPITFEILQEAPQNEWPSDLAEQRATGTGAQGDSGPPPAASQ